VLNLSTTVTGTAGGNWTGTGVNAVGLFNPSLILGGSSSITYTVGTGTCQSISTQTILVETSGSPAWTLPAPLCTGAASINLTSQITGSTGGTWSGTGVSSTGNFLPGTSVGSFPITYTVGSGTCQAVSTQNIAVIASGNAAWTVPINLCSNSAVLNLSTTITGTAGGNWTGTGVTAAGLFNPSLILGGSSSITYTVGTGSCQSNSTQTILVGTSGSPAWTLPAPFCTGAASINLSSQITGSTGGTWSGTGVSSTGIFLPGTSAGSFPITYTVGSGTCQSISTQNIVVIASGNPAWTAPTNLCSNSAALNLSTTVTGTAGGNWTGTGVTASGIFDPSGLSGDFPVTYSVSIGTCQSTQTNTILVSSAPEAPFVNGTILYCANDLIEPLTAFGATGASFSWYSDLTLGNILSNSINFTPTASNTSLWVTQDVDGCVSPPVQVEITINPIPSAPIVQDVYNYCEGNLPPELSVTGNGGTYNWYESSALNSLLFTGSLYQGTNSGSFQVWVTESLNGCESNSSIINVVEQGLIQAAISPTGPISICDRESVKLTSSSLVNNLWSTGESTQDIEVTSLQIRLKY
jgi:hypothetical protein